MFKNSKMSEVANRFRYIYLFRAIQSLSSVSSFLTSSLFAILYFFALIFIDFAGYFWEFK